jgi:hypothetical protein
MSKQITNEQAEQGLYIFFNFTDNSEKYNDFREYWSSIVSMVAHKQFGWIDGITELGYEQVVLAYKELAELGYFDDNDNGW